MPVALLDVYQRNPVCETGAVDEKEIYWTQDLNASNSIYLFPLFIHLHQTFQGVVSF